jgi:hypothetical protein
MSSSVQETSTIITSTIKRILDRLVDLAITFGVTYPTFEGMLKRSYVQRATKGFKIDDKEQTDSRISLLTGIHRRDIRLLRAALDHDKPLAASLETRVARAWSAPPFIDENGKRAPLPRLASVGGMRSFESLVQHVSTDIRAAVLLNDWTNKGFARVDEQDQVVFESDSYFGIDSKVADTCSHLAHTTSDLISGFTGILRNENPRPMAMGFVNCDYLSEESMEKIFNYCRELIKKQNSEINRLGEDASMGDRQLSNARMRFTFCGYVYRVNLDLDQPVQWAEPGME